ncbi:MAG: hypothetical protein LBD41_03165 [Clostridiales Family XIII bacterium]|jgi:hypothetical protein|nr:hypothetical protein [Clostridiales Family XIII bacterium]
MKVITLDEVRKHNGIHIHLDPTYYESEADIWVFPHLDHFHIISPTHPDVEWGEKGFHEIYSEDDFQIMLNHLFEWIDDPPNYNITVF